MSGPRAKKITYENDTFTIVKKKGKVKLRRPKAKRRNKTEQSKNGH